MLNKFKLFGVVAMLAATTLMLASCQKTEDKLVGKWKITKAPSQADDDEGEQWTFKENGKCSIYSYGSDIDGTWTVSDDNLVIEMEPVEGDGYKVTGTLDLTIDELTKEELAVSGSFTQKYKDDYGNSDSQKLKANYEFTRK